MQVNNIQTNINSQVNHCIESMKIMRWLLYKQLVLSWGCYQQSMWNTQHAIRVQTRDDREWLFTFPLPPIPVQSIPIPSHSHSQFCNQFPFPWDSHKAFPIPSHSHSRTLHRCSINYFGAREDSSLNMPLKLTISCVHFYSTETRKNSSRKSFDLWFA